MKILFQHMIHKRPAAAAAASANWRLLLNWYRGTVAQTLKRSYAGDGKNKFVHHITFSPMI